MTSGRVLAILALALLSLSCATRGSAPPASPEDQLRQATAAYAALVRAMDHSAIAALFTPDGEMASEGQPTVRGREAIKQHLESFKDFHVQANTLTADTVTVHGAAGDVAGTYWQRVELPSHEVVEVRGTYTAHWLRGADGTWRIQRVATAPRQ